MDYNFVNTITHIFLPSQTTVAVEKWLGNSRACWSHTSQGGVEATKTHNVEKSGQSVRSSIRQFTDLVIVI